MRRTKDTKDILRLAVCSDLRSNILNSLNEEKKSLAQLRDGLKISSTTAIHALRELEKSNLTFEDKDRNYSLTEIGRIIALKLIDFSTTAEVLKRHERFWLEHDLSGIPVNLLKNLTALYNSELIQSTVTPDSVQRFITEIFRSAKEEILGISPIVTLDWAKAVIERANSGIKVSLITTDNVLKISHEDKFKNFSPIHHPNIYLWVNNDLRLGLISNKETMGLTLIDIKSNILDIDKILASNDPVALKWGESLFNGLKKKSQKLR